MNEKKLACAHCSTAWRNRGTTYCWSDPENRPKAPAHCPSPNEKELTDETLRLYNSESEDARLAKTAAIVEGMCYRPQPGADTVTARWTRVEDTISLAKLMNYKKIGIATCIGLLDESARLAEILSAQGFAPLSVCCKTGSIDKKALGLSEENKVRPGTFEPACNPIAQAELLNRAESEMNIIMGLCVGHDMLFTRHAHAPTTTLVAKDRVTGHNPVAVLYGQNFYYKRLQKQQVITEEEVKNYRE